jgi:hypothetical protein
LSAGGGAVVVVVVAGRVVVVVAGRVVVVVAGRVVVVVAGRVVVVVAGRVVVVVVVPWCRRGRADPWLVPAAPVRTIRLIPAAMAAVTRFRGMPSPSEPPSHPLRTGTIRRWDSLREEVEAGDVAVKVTVRRERRRSSE